MEMTLGYLGLVSGFPQMLPALQQNVGVDVEPSLSIMGCGAASECVGVCCAEATPIFCECVLYVYDRCDPLEI